jgi:hypothetical protein
MLQPAPWGGPMACPVPSRSERSGFGRQCELAFIGRLWASPTMDGPPICADTSDAVFEWCLIPPNFDNARLPNRKVRWRAALAFALLRSLSNTRGTDSKSLSEFVKLQALSDSPRGAGCRCPAGAERLAGKWKPREQGTAASERDAQR